MTARAFASLVAAVMVSGIAQTPAPKPDLVLTPGAGGRVNTIFSIGFFPADALTILGGSGNRVESWTIGPGEEFRDFGGNYTDVRAAERIDRASADDAYLVTSSPLQMFVWDLRRQKRISEIKTRSLDGFPLSCHSSQICAWEEADSDTRAIRLQPILNNAPARQLSISSDVALSLAISRDGSRIAAAVNRPVVRLWSVADGTERTALALEADAAAALVPPEPGTPVKTMFMRSAAASSVIRFSPDGKSLAAANDSAIHVFPLTGGPARLLRGFGHINALDFDGTGQHLFFCGADRVLRVWDLRPDSVSPAAIGTLDEKPVGITARADGKILAIGFPGGRIQLWDIQERRLAATILLLPAGQGWIAFAPNGMFETSEGAWRYASWRLPQAPAAMIPIERFYKNFYDPGLIAAVLRGERIPTPEDIGQTEIRVPSVALQVVGRTAPAATLVPGKGIVQTPETIRFRIEARPGSPRDVVRDLALLHNGSVVRKWRGVLRLTGGVAAEEVELEMFPGDNTVSVFAFNADGVRSPEESWDRKMQGWGYVVPQRTLYVIDIGIGDYPNRDYHLDFAARDADLVEQAFTIADATLASMRSRLADYVNERSVALLETTRAEEMPAKIVVTKLVNGNATRAKILETIKTSVEHAGINDALLLYFSGHGIATDDAYYLLPFDMVLKGSPADGRGQVPAALGTLISDADLETALLPLNVSFAAVVLDACESGAALEGADLRGPLDSSGLARLAYEKGIYLLAAAEAQHPAAELQQLGNSVLTYALFREGLQQQKADTSPMDGRIDLKEWLAYGAQRVTGLFEAHSSQRFAQTARFAPKWTPEKTVLVLSTASKQP
jgi:WD40 repeat protein/uncharacterized caspase-like protein